MIRAVLLLAVASLLGACAASVHSGNENSVVINQLNAFNSKDALALADAHCAQYGQKAKMGQVLRNAIVFECVRPQ
jgi:hypothetical protein